jgi:hypothetical protein
LLLSLGVPLAAQIRPAAKAVAPIRPVRWSPRPVFNGAPVLFVSKTFSGPATWLGKQIEFRPDGDVFSALAGVNLNRPVGKYPLLMNGETIDVPVGRRTYPLSLYSRNS